MWRDLMDFRAIEITSNSRPSTFNSQRKIPKCPFCKGWCNMFLDAFWCQIMILFCKVLWYYILLGIKPDWIEIGPLICSCRNEGILNNESFVNIVVANASSSWIKIFVQEVVHCKLIGSFSCWILMWKCKSVIVAISRCIFWSSIESNYLHMDVTLIQHRNYIIEKQWVNKVSHACISS
jgi:hypothetical protein